MCGEGGCDYQCCHGCLCAIRVVGRGIVVACVLVAVVVIRVFMFDAVFTLIGMNPCY